MKRGERGSVLAAVLVLALVGGLIASELVSARLQPSLLAAQRVQRLSDDMAGQAAISRINEVWARLGSCSSDAAEGVSCSGSGCSCTCDSATAVVSVRQGAGGSCVMTATAK